MSDPVKQLETLLRQEKYTLIREGKHLVYRNPKGQTFVTAATPSDHRWAKNQLATLRRQIAGEGVRVPLVVAIADANRAQARPVPARPLPTARKATKNGNRGIGIRYITKHRKQLTAEDRTASVLASVAQKQQENGRRIRRQDERDFIASAEKYLVAAGDHVLELHQQFFGYLSEAPCPYDAVLELADESKPWPASIILPPGQQGTLAASLLSTSVLELMQYFLSLQRDKNIQLDTIKIRFNREMIEYFWDAASSRAAKEISRVATCFLPQTAADEQELPLFYLHSPGAKADLLSAYVLWVMWDAFLDWRASLLPVLYSSPLLAPVAC
jgi:hypothetical protein